MIGRFATSAGILVLVLGPAGYGAVAVAQEPTYSADSLMSAFDPGSRLSLKGTTIALEGPISESSRTRLVFRSSKNDKVICELRSPLSSSDTRYAVGNQIAVVGKVRGRGLLGNVTLDQCSAATPTVSAEEPPPLPETVEASAPPPEEMVVTTPIETEVAAVAPIVPTPAEQPTTGRVMAPPAARVKKLPPSTEDLDPPDPAITQPTEPMPEPEQQATVIKEDPESTNAYLQGVFHTLAAILSIVGVVLAAVKVGPMLATRFRTPSHSPSAEETRRAALEILLTKEQRKKH
jgi:hypothetical protein